MRCKLGPVPGRGDVPIVDGVSLSETGSPAGARGGAGGTLATTRVADVLLAIATSDGDVGVSALARSLGLSKSVTHRILRSLAGRGLVVARPEGTYGVGPAAAVLGARALEDLDLRAAALPVLRRLREQTGETTTVSSLVGTARVYLDQAVSTNEVKMSVELGRGYPLHAGSTGKAILAVAPPELRAYVLGHSLPRLTEATIVAGEELERELGRIAAEGVAVSRGERQPGAGSVAAPVYAGGGVVVGAVSVCGPVDRFGPAAVERYKPLVRAAADEVTATLAGRHAANGDGVAP